MLTAECREWKRVGAEPGGVKGGLWDMEVEVERK
jgi:hypothetical protein